MAVTAALQGLLYLAAARGDIPSVLRWDPHFVYTPLLVTVLTLTLYISRAPAARGILVIGWLMALPFASGFGAFWPLVALSGLFAAVYLSTVLAAAPPGIVSWPEEIIRTALVLAGSVVVSASGQRLRALREHLHRFTAELEELAITDPLTRLHNRRSLEEMLAMEISRSARFAQPFTLAMLDLDDFKVYNDTLGHPAGDGLLRELAVVMRSGLRGGDFVARYGGEEFAVLLPGTRRTEALAALEHLRRRVEEHHFAGAEVLPGGRLTISVGVAIYPDHATEAMGLITRADDALYRAKSLGKNRIEVASPGRRGTLSAE